MSSHNPPFDTTREALVSLNNPWFPLNLQTSFSSRTLKDREKSMEEKFMDNGFEMTKIFFNTNRVHLHL